jgi:Flp pilus assembly protein protease CpaA
VKHKKATKMTISRKIGIALLVVSLVMAVTGGSVFTSHGVSSTLSKIGMYSFFFWLPTLFVAIVLIVAGRKKKQKKISP